MRPRNLLRLLVVPVLLVGASCGGGGDDDYAERTEVPVDNVVHVKFQGGLDRWDDEAADVLEVDADRMIGLRAVNWDAEPRELYVIEADSIEELPVGLVFQSDLSGFAPTLLEEQLLPGQLVGKYELPPLGAGTSDSIWDIEVAHELDAGTYVLVDPTNYFTPEETLTLHVVAP